jgi:predicted nucleotidyltransferase
MTTARDLTPQQMEAYLEATRHRRDADREALATRMRRAWELAQDAAALLRERFHAERVVVFGSLIHPDSFTPWSDVDIAAWGLRPEDTFRAMGAVADLDRAIAVNLVDVAACKPAILRVIEDEGLPL